MHTETKGDLVPNKGDSQSKQDYLCGISGTLYNFIVNQQGSMDPRPPSNVNRTGSIGAPNSSRLNQSQQNQIVPDYRSNPSVSSNRGPVATQASLISSNSRQADSIVPRLPVRADNELEGEFYDQQGQSQAVLAWSILPEDENLVIQGSSDYNILSKLRNILLSLRDEFVSGTGKVVITGDQRQNLNQRMILLEGEIEGLMKRKINYTVKDTQGGHRTLDYTNLLNEKENQVVELQKKINNLEERLRRAAARELELQNHIVILSADLKRKDVVIRSKNQQILSEVAASNQFRETINRLKRNIDQNRSQLGGLDKSILQGVTFPDFTALDIRSDALTKDGSIPRTNSYSGSSSGFQNKTQLIALFREFERLNSAEGISEADFERILQGFLIGLKGNRLGDLVNVSLESRRAIESSIKLKEKFNTAVALYRSQIEKVKRQNPSIRIQVDKNIIDLLENDKVNIDRVEGGVVFMERFSEKTIQVPVQDTRSKHLLHLFASELKQLSTKYPKILSEIDVRLSEFFQQQLIDIIEVDEIDRIVSIVKYVPQVVKVQNVYAYSNEKSRKVEFHLRVLIKALLEEVQKLKSRHGLVLQIDEGVIGMINQQIMGIVDVDDILKVFRVVPKIVEVEKIVQKIVDRIVEVPQVITIQKIVEKIIQIQKIREVQKIVNVPLQIPTIVNTIVQKIVPIETIIQKVIEVPTVTDRIVEVTREVSKIVEVERIVQKIVEVEKVIEVERQVNHFVPEIREVTVQVDKIVTVQNIVEKIVEVPTFIERIVEKYVEVPQIVEVQKIVQKIVEKIEYKIEKQMIPYIQIEHRIVERIVQKPVIVIQKEERIIHVPQIIEKIVQVRTIQQEIRQIEVFKDKIIIQEKIREVEKEVPKLITLKEEVEKIVEKRVEIPFIVQKIVIVPEIVTKPVIQRVETTIIKQVVIREPLIVRQPKIVEIEKQVIHYIDVPRVVKHFEEKIIQVPKHIEVIKEVRVHIEKIIEKMVEVPKVVEVERIVEKIVVVPRVIEKIVEIPQIVEVTVERIVIQQVIREVERIIQVPVFQERIVEVQVEKNVYIEVEKVIDRYVDKLVEVVKLEERIVTNEIINERIVQVRVEVPKQIQVQKIITNIVEREHVVEIERPQVIPVEIRYPVEKIVQKLVPVYETREIIQQVPQIIEKIVEVKVPEIQIREIQQIVKEIVVDTKIVEVPSEKIVIQEKIREVEVIREKPVPIITTVQEIVTAELIVEKIIQRVIQIPKVYQVQRVVEKIVETPQIVQIETLVPQLIRVKQYIQNVVEKIVEVPLILERIKEIQKERDRIVQVHTTVTEIVEVERIVEKAVIMQKFREVVKNINHIEQVLQIVDRYEQQPVQIHTREEKIVEVPHILEKIVEKIVVMPQIVQVLKYVHEIVETESLGVAVGVDVAIHEQKYQTLSRNIQGNLDGLIKELNVLMRSNPALKGQIEMILRFLAEFNQFILYPKIIQIPVEKIVQRVVEKEKIVRVPVQDQRSLRMELTLSLLVQKLLIELKRIKNENQNIQLNLDDDINLIFFSELGVNSNIISGDFNTQLKTFSQAIQRKFETLGSWTLDHQIMLNSFLQERFVMANIVKNCNLEIEKSKAISEKRLEGLRRYKTERMGYESHSKSLLELLPKILESTRDNPQLQVLSGQIEGAMADFNQFITSQVFTSNVIEPMRNLEDLQISDQRISSLIRTKDAEITRLREQLFGAETSKAKGSSEFNQKTILILQQQNTKLKNEISQLQTKLSDPRINADSDIRFANLNEQILKLEQEKSDLNAQLINTRNLYKTKLQLGESEIEQLNVRLSQQNTKTTKYSEGTPNRNPAPKREGDSNFGTPVTGARQSPEDDNIKTVQSGYYTANTPGSSVSENSGVSSSYGQNQQAPSTGLGASQGTSYGPRQNTLPTTQTSGVTGTTGNFGNNSGRMTGSGHTGTGSAASSTYGTGASGIGGLAGTSSTISGVGSTQRSSTTGDNRDTLGSAYTPTGTTYGPTGTASNIPANKPYGAGNFTSAYTANQPGTGSLGGAGNFTSSYATGNQPKTGSLGGTGSLGAGSLGGTGSGTGAGTTYGPTSNLGATNNAAQNSALGSRGSYNPTPGSSYSQFGQPGNTSAGSFSNNLSQSTNPTSTVNPNPNPNPNPTNSTNLGNPANQPKKQ